MSFTHEILSAIKTGLPRVDWACKLLWNYKNMTHKQAFCRRTATLYNSLYVIAGMELLFSCYSRPNKCRRKLALCRSMLLMLWWDLTCSKDLFQIFGTYTTVWMLSKPLIVIRQKGHSGGFLACWQSLIAHPTHSLWWHSQIATFTGSSRQIPQSSSSSKLLSNPGTEAARAKSFASPLNLRDLVLLPLQAQTFSMWELALQFLRATFFKALRICHTTLCRHKQDDNVRRSQWRDLCKSWGLNMSCDFCFALHVLQSSTMGPILGLTITSTWFRFD